MDDLEERRRRKQEEVEVGGIRVCDCGVVVVGEKGRRDGRRRIDESVWISANVFDVCSYRSDVTSNEGRGYGKMSLQACIASSHENSGGHCCWER